MNSDQAVIPLTQTFEDVLNQRDIPLALDSYQRGFVWNTEKIQQLVEDLNDYLKLPCPKPAYYMGTILLHQEPHKERRYIIDGQQRLTALCLLHHRVKGHLPEGIEMTYSGQSKRCILKAHDYLGQFKNLPPEAIFSQLCFTVITVNNTDLAFSFFDTQNNRGVPLQATDLLKAYHLRSVHQKNRNESLQKHCATRWESLQRQPFFMSEKADFAPDLFGKFLWRARRWRGRQVPQSTHDGLIQEFQSNSWALDNDATDNQCTVPVYPCHNNQRAHAMQWEAGTVSTKEQAENNVLPSPGDYPMALRQPIHKGLSFFLYADKYASLLRRLWPDSNHSPAVEKPGHNIDDSPQIQEFRRIDKQLLCANQFYLREVFWLAALMYLDQFGDRKLATFSLYLEYLLGGIRLKKSRVVMETAANFFRDGELNLLDVIGQSYHPDQVLEYLQQQQPKYSKHYTDRSIPVGKGVQGRYKKAVLDYFHPDSQPTPDHLTDKWQWVLTKAREVTP